MTEPKISKSVIGVGYNLTVAWKSKKALAWRVNSPISVVLGAQLTSTSGKDFLPSLWLHSYDSIMNLGAFSGSSGRASVFSEEIRTRCNGHTVNQVFDRDLPELLDFLYG